jgi:UDPglucose 6-dehydrogenase
MKKSISIIGLGKLGAPMLAVFSSKGYKVIGVDINQSVVDIISLGLAPINEPQMDQFLKLGKGNYLVTKSVADAVTNSDVTFIIVPTPSKSDGFFDNSYLLKALEEVGAILAKKNKWHNVVVTSTVMPGSMSGELRERIETSSDKRAGIDFGFCYNPEFIALGSVIHDMLNPDLVLIGESDAKSGEILAELYSSICNNNPKIKRMSWAEAEITKLAVNTFVTTKISFANMLSELCEKIPGTDVDVISGAIGCDTRIGSKYLTGAVAFGGPCFPRDSKAFDALGRNLGVCTGIASATHFTNEHQTRRIIEKVTSLTTNKKSTIGIVGLTYKNGTPVIEESAGSKLAFELVERGFLVGAHEPCLRVSVLKALHEGLKVFDDLQSIVSWSDIIVFMNANETVKRELESFRALSGENKVFIDPWRFLDASKFPVNVNYIPMGVGVVALGENKCKEEAPPEKQFFDIVPDGLLRQRSATV